jgi:hypothetical protein
MKESVHGKRSRYLGGMFTPFTGLASAEGVSVHTGVCVYKTHTCEHTLDSFQASTEALLSAFPGSEIVFDVPAETMTTAAAVAWVSRWNDWQSVLSEDRPARGHE